MREALFLLFGALIVLVVGAVFVFGIYRIAGLKPTRLERRRWAFNGAWLALLLLVPAMLIALGLSTPIAITAGVMASAAPVILASWLLRGRHWLFTPSADEQSEIARRRETMLALRRRPAFWLFAVSLVVLIPALLVALAIATRGAR